MSSLFGKSLKSRLMVSLALVICFLVALVVLLPFAIQLTAQSWLRDQGLEASIELVGFNVKTGIFRLNNAKGTNADQQGFVLDRALLEINWKPLFKKQLDIQRFEIEGLSLDVTSTDKGLSVAGIAMPAPGGNQEKVAKTPDTEPTAWSAQIQNIELANIKVCHNNPAVAASDTLTVQQMMNACVTLGNMKWQGRISWSAAGKDKPATAGITVSGNLLVDNLLYAAKISRQRFVNIGKLAINNFQSTGFEIFKTDLVEISNVELLQLSKKQDAPYLASWQTLKIDKPAFEQQKQHAIIQTITLSGLKSNIKRAKTGITGLPVSSQEKQQKKTANKANTDKAFTFVINKMLVNGRSQVSFTDNTVDPVFNESLSNLNLTVTDINSAKPGNKSTLTADVKVGEYGNINIKGTVQPFADRITLDLHQDIKNIDLANYNVYGKTFIGHRIRSGQLDLKQKITIDNGKLDTESTLVLNKFKVESLQGKEAEKYKSDLGIPLSTALSLLRDKNDNIKLTLPVTGDMNSPDFSLNDVISTVTGKAIREAIINYYTPFGLVKFLGGVVDLATGLSFEPVKFAAGKAELEQAGKDKLTTLSKLLTERPHVQLTLCGFPVKDDIFARYKPAELGLNNGDEKKPLKLTDKQTSELLALFKARMDNMKKFMVRQLKVDPGQVLLCSEPDNKEWITGVEAKPEVAISI
ncbi:MAG: DUF748 domain-containing protein [Gammaproteobacteria bacterium]